MATATVTVASNGVSSNCGSWSGLQWQASGCAVNTFGQDAVTFTSAIPVGSTITGISGSVDAHTSGVASTQPGYMSVTATNGISSAGTLRASAVITDTSTNYPFNVTGLSIVVDASTFNSALTVVFLNKENVYTSNHNLGVADMTITYDPPASSNNLFFGSTF